MAVHPLAVLLGLGDFVALFPEIGADLLGIGDGDDRAAGAPILPSFRRRRGAEAIGRTAARTAGAEDHARAETSYSKGARTFRCP